MITKLDSDSSTANAGLQRGDMIEEVNCQPVGNIGDFEADLRKASKKSVSLRLRQGKYASFVIVKPRE